MSQVFLGQLLEELASNAGIEIDDKLKDVFKSKEASAVIGADVADKFRANLIGMNNAEHHSELRQKMFGKAYGTWDTKMKKYAQEALGIDPDTYKQIRGGDDKSAIDVFPALLQHAVEMGKRKGEEMGGLNSKELRDKLKAEVENEYGQRLKANAETISKLQNTVSAFEEEKKKIVGEFENKFHQEKVRGVLSQKINGLTFAPTLGDYTDRIKSEVTSDIMNGFVWKEENGALIPYDKNDPSARAMKGSKMLQADDIITEMTAKWVAKQPAKPVQNGTRIPAAPGSGDGSKKRITPSFEF